MQHNFSRWDTHELMTRVVLLVTRLQRVGQPGAVPLAALFQFGQ